MKLDDRYKIEVVVIEKIGENDTGDCYSDFQQFIREHPFAECQYGFIVLDTKTGLIPDGCNDWNDSVEEAIFDWEDNCKRNNYLKEAIMSEGQFYNYIIENFSLSGEARRLIHNIIHYVRAQGFVDKDDEHSLLIYLLDGIGLTKEEVNQTNF